MTKMAFSHKDCDVIVIFRSVALCDWLVKGAFTFNLVKVLLPCNIFLFSVNYLAMSCTNAVQNKVE